MQAIRLPLVTLAALLLGIPLAAAGQDDDLDVPFVPTRPETVAQMLTMAKVGEGDVVYDLGSGDGRIVIAAARRGARAIGVDKDPERIAEARENAREAGVEEKVEFRQGDLFDADFSEADVVTMYLLPDVNMKLRAKILQMEPGTRVVSHAFDMQDWQPDAMSRDSGQAVFLWIVPAQVEGQWQWQVGQGQGARKYQVELDQDFQEVSGSARVDGRPAEITDARLRGGELVLVIQPEDGEPQRFTARYRDGALVAVNEDGQQVVAERVSEETRG